MILLARQFNSYINLNFNLDYFNEFSLEQCFMLMIC